MQPGGTYIVKRLRHRGGETFSSEKLQKSIVAALLSSGSHEGQADSTARRVVTEVEKWLEDRPEVTSEDLRRVAGEHLTRYHPDAGYLYKHHNRTL